MSVNDVEWSEWVLFSEALATAPRVPGVYMAREGEAREIVYIGMVGERSGIPIGCGPVSPNLKRLGRVAPTTGASKRSRCRCNEPNPSWRHGLRLKIVIDQARVKPSYPLTATSAQRAT